MACNETNFLLVTGGGGSCLSHSLTLQMGPRGVCFRWLRPFRLPTLGGLGLGLCSQCPETMKTEAQVLQGVSKALRARARATAQFTPLSPYFTSPLQLAHPRI